MGGSALRVLLIACTQTRSPIGQFYGEGAYATLPRSHNRLDWQSDQYCRYLYAATVSHALRGNPENRKAASCPAQFSGGVRVFSHWYRSPWRLPRARTPRTPTSTLPPVPTHQYLTLPPHTCAQRVFPVTPNQYVKLYEESRTSIGTLSRTERGIDPHRPAKAYIYRTSG